jgi:hypothetical protein
VFISPAFDRRESLQSDFDLRDDSRWSKNSASGLRWAGQGALVRALGICFSILAAKFLREAEVEEILIDETTRKAKGVRMKRVRFGCDAVVSMRILLLLI